MNKRNKKKAQIHYKNKNLIRKVYFQKRFITTIVEIVKISSNKSQCRRNTHSIFVNMIAPITKSTKNGIDVPKSNGFDNSIEFKEARSEGGIRIHVKDYKSDYICAIDWIKNEFYVFETKELTKNGRHRTDRKFRFSQIKTFEGFSTSNVNLLSEKVLEINKSIW